MHRLGVFENGQSAELEDEVGAPAHSQGVDRDEVAETETVDLRLCSDSNPNPKPAAYHRAVGQLQGQGLYSLQSAVPQCALTMTERTPLKGAYGRDLDRLSQEICY